jgi:uncharacterized protein (DUF39 family)
MALRDRKIEELNQLIMEGEVAIVKADNLILNFTSNNNEDYE